VCGERRRKAGEIQLSVRHAINSLAPTDLPTIQENDFKQANTAVSYSKMNGGKL